MAEQSFHARSISMPSRSHPTTQRIAEKLHSLRSCEAPETSLPSTSTSSTKVVCQKLKCLGDLYADIQDLLHLPSIQQRIANSNQKKWQEEELNGSLAVLDLSSAMKDVMIALKEHVQDLQLASRRKSSDPCTKKVQALRKEMQSIMKKCNKELKKLHGESKLSNSEVLVELHKAREATYSILLSVSSSMSIIKPSKWSYASKVMLKKRIACDEDLAELQCLQVLASDKSSALTQDQLEQIKTILEEVENGLEILYRYLIQHRVSILNIISL